MMDEGGEGSGKSLISQDPLHNVQCYVYACVVLTQNMANQ